MSGPTCSWLGCEGPALWRFTDAEDDWLQQYACDGHSASMDMRLRESHPALVMEPFLRAPCTDDDEHDFRPYHDPDDATHNVQGVACGHLGTQIRAVRATDLFGKGK